MNQNDKSEKPKKRGWRIAGFAALGVLLIAIVTAVLVVNGLFKSLKEEPVRDVPSQTAEDPKTPVTEIETVPKKDEQVDVAVVRTLMVPEETLDEIDAEEKNAILEAIQENAASAPDTDGVYSVLLIGIDNRDVALTERTDCIFLASVNQNTNRLVLTAFPQNLYVYIPDWDSTNFLHVANAMGSPELAAKAIEQNFGVKIDAYASISFNSFARAVDAFGGVEMPLSAEELGRLSGVGYAPEKTAQDTYRLSGEQVLAYCANSTDHTSSRFTVIRKLWEQSRHASFTKRYEVAQQTLKDVSTTITMSQCLNLLMDITDLHRYEMFSVRLPAEGMYESRLTDDMTVLVADITANTAYIREMIYGNSAT